MTKIDKHSFDLGIIMAAITMQIAHGDPVVAASVITETGADLDVLIGTELMNIDVVALMQILDQIDIKHRVFVRAIDASETVRIESIAEIEVAA
ncbi:hypothetical protein [Roseobacter sp. TSBP12]|uniref:hypothetical protein n=1 Tax=Roseobacter sp. TSBP12 TaxID=1236613 RepID=UPI00125F7FC3|nr:hypothetical protein [Roseobacter sp. TSBP12]KAB6717744.1 hypothetical protein C8029_04280 [Roseobacter sp. TSBP12]